MICELGKLVSILKFSFSNVLICLVCVRQDQNKQKMENPPNFKTSQSPTEKCSRPKIQTILMQQTFYY